jgi:hypothetical protein
MEISTPAKPLAIKRSAIPNINEFSFGLLPSDPPTMTPGALTDRHGPWSRVVGACFREGRGSGIPRRGAAFGACLGAVGNLFQLRLGQGRLDGRCERFTELGYDEIEFFLS